MSCEVGGVILLIIQINIQIYRKSLTNKRMSNQYSSHSLIPTITQNLNLQPNQFQIFLEKLHRQQPLQTCQVIAQLQFTTKTKQQKQKLATSFNFFVQKFFKLQDKNPQIWSIFINNIAGRKQRTRKDELTQWKLAKITQKSFIKFVQSFQNQFTPILQQVYQKLNSSHKILLQGIVIRNDIDQQARLLFLKQNLVKYINLGLQLFRQISLSSVRQLELNQQQIEQQMNNRLSQYLVNLKQTFVYLNFQSQGNNDEEYLFNKISQSEEIFELIHETIFLNFLGDEYKVYQNSNGNQDKKIPLLFNQIGSFRKQQSHNNMKSLGLQIFNQVLNRFSYQSNITHFDQSKILSLMQNIVPSIVQQLIQMKSNKLQLNENQKLTIAMLCTLRKSTRYIFMNNYFWNNYKIIFWKIIYPLLKSSDEQLRQYQDDPEAFIAQAQVLSQKEFEDPEKIQSCKTYAAFLLQNIIQNVDGALTYISTVV